MLVDTDSTGADRSGDAMSVPATKAAAAPVVPAGRYGDERGMSLSTVFGVVALHAVVFLTAAYLQPHFTKEKQHRLKVIEVSLAPPPAPAKPVEPPKAKAPEVVKLSPVVTPQQPVPMLAATIAPTEAQPMAPPVSAPVPVPPAPPAPPPPSTVQGGNLGTQMVSGKPPRYPVECRRNREQGTVVLALVLGTDGRVQTIAISRSSGSPRLDAAARDAVRSWRWSPTIRDGHPVMVKGVVEIPFVLQG